MPTANPATIAWNTSASRTRTPGGRTTAAQRAAWKARFATFASLARARWPGRAPASGRPPAAGPPARPRTPRTPRRRASPASRSNARRPGRSSGGTASARSRFHRPGMGPRRIAEAAGGARRPRRRAARPGRGLGRDAARHRWSRSSVAGRGRRRPSRSATTTSTVRVASYPRTPIDRYSPSTSRATVGQACRCAVIRPALAVRGGADRLAREPHERARPRARDRRR